MSHAAELLPPSATATERRVADVCEQALDQPVALLRTLHNADACPPWRLPSLAAERSVDRWDERWSESVKRKVIKASPFVHQHKGTIGALRRAVEPLGYLIRVREWWQSAPVGVRGTFALDIGVLDTGITSTMYTELERLIDDAKPLTRHMTGLAISLESRGPLYLGAACYLGDEITIYPYEPGPVTAQVSDWHGGITHTIDTLTIRPGTA